MHRGSCFMPVIRRSSRGLYLSQFLVNDINRFYTYPYPRLLFAICSSSVYLFDDRKNETGILPVCESHQSLVCTLTSILFANFVVVYHDIFYLNSLRTMSTFTILLSYLRKPSDFLPCTSEIYLGLCSMHLK